MNIKIISIIALLCLALTLAAAQQPAPAPHPGPQPGPDPFGGSFFPPELVIQNQQAIGLSDEQKTYFRTEIRDAQLKFTDLQWKLQDEMEKMVSLVKQPRVDEQQVMAQLDKVLTAEREIKRAQIALLVHIKNKLTADQQAKLEDIRSKFQR
ncbi:MAG TPA: periplasmic heavy metal sensor [Candidatus Angelobacter sp.]